MGIRPLGREEIGHRPKQRCQLPVGLLHDRVLAGLLWDLLPAGGKGGFIDKANYGPIG
jgi:hypothetical protein